MRPICKYYRYQTEKKRYATHCKAGIEYREVAKVGTFGIRGGSLRLPCMGAEPGTQPKWAGGPVQECEKYE